MRWILLFLTLQVLATEVILDPYSDIEYTKLSIYPRSSKIDYYPECACPSQDEPWYLE